MKVRDGGHIGLDSLVRRLSPKARMVVIAIQHLSLIAFAIMIMIGCGSMAAETMGDRIPIIGLPEGVRYLIAMPAAIAIIPLARAPARASSFYAGTITPWNSRFCPSVF